MKIRKPQQEDLPSVMPLLKAFHEESLSFFDLGWDETSVMATMQFFMDNHVALLVEDDFGEVIGVIAGIISPYFLNHHVKIFQEAVWFIKAEHRSARAGMQLFDLMEDYCVRIGIQKIVMVSMFNLNYEKLGRFYEGRGYKPMETQFIKGLNHAGIS